MFYYCEECGVVNKNEKCDSCKTKKTTKVYEYECIGDCSHPESIWFEETKRVECPVCSGKIIERGNNEIQQR